MFAKQQRNAFIIKNILIILGALILATILISFLSSQISSTANRVFKNRQTTLALEKRSSELSELASKVNGAQGNESIIQSAFVPVDDILEFVGALESIASKNSLLQTFGFGNPAPIPDSGAGLDFSLSKIDYTINLQSNILGLIAYLKDFENIPFFAKINSVSVISQTTEGLDANSGITLQGTLYAKNNTN